MRVSLVFLPSVGTPEEMRSGCQPARQTATYQRMLAHVIEQAQYAEDLGYYSVAFTEHHFETEGLEVSPNPLMLAMLAGVNTKRIRVGTMGVQLPAWNPIRLAEEVAMVDQIVKGRLDLGIVRGSGAREVPHVGQNYGLQLAGRQTPEDEANWQLHVEHYGIVRKLLDHPGDATKIETEHWKIPVPGATVGDDEYTRWAGGFGEIVKDGTNFGEHGLSARVGDLSSPDNLGYRMLLREGRAQRAQIALGICPLPYQRPFPKFYVPFTTTPKTIEWAAREGMKVVFQEGSIPRFQAMAATYAQAAAACGYDLAPCENVCPSGWFGVADTEDEVRRMAEPMMWFRLVRTNGLTQYPGEPQPEKLTWERFAHNDHSEATFVGTPDRVVQRVGKFIEETKTSHLQLLCGSDMVPHARMMKSLELFAGTVMPQLGGMENADSLAVAR